MARKVLLILLALALALSIGLLACTPPVEEEEEEEEEPELMIYEVRPVEVTPEYVQALALTLLPIVTGGPDETEDMYYMSSEPYYLESCKNSGSIWYADESRLYNEDYVPEVLPAADDAREFADEFLEALIGEVIPEPESLGYEFFDVGETETTIFDLDTEETVTVINHLDVLYSFEELDGIPVEGPGAKIRVSIGDDGEVIGLHYVWREVEPFEVYPAITEQEATAILEEKLQAEPEELEVRRGYYAESEFTKQDFLQPYWIFDGTMMIEGEEVQLKTQLIPATTFSPVVRIVSPEYDAEFLEGDTIDFEASVSGGREPYEYVWESDVDGVIGTAPSFSSELSVAARDEEVLPHTIKLTVTDGNGNQDIALISVKVVPVGSTSILTMAPAPEEIQTLSTGSPRDDTNDKEVGIEWVNAYGSKGTLSNNDDNARGFKNQLVADGWASRFDWGDWWAWEEDFKCRSCAGGGTDYVWIDAVDFAFFSGHGDPRYILFKSSRDSQRFYFSSARWGGDAAGTGGEAGDLEWIVLDACLTLARSAGGQSVFQRWRQAFDGLHYVLGFDTVCSDVSNRGSLFAQNMRQNRTVRAAWIRATQATQSSSCMGAYLRAGSSAAQTWNDHLPGHGYVSPDPYPYTYLAYSRWSC